MIKISLNCHLIDFYSLGHENCVLPDEVTECKIENGNFNQQIKGFCAIFSVSQVKILVHRTIRVK